MVSILMRVSGELFSLALVSSAWSLDEVDVSWDCSLENEFNCSFVCYIRLAHLLRQLLLLLCAVCV